MVHSSFIVFSQIIAFQQTQTRLLTALNLFSSIYNFTKLHLLNAFVYFDFLKQVRVSVNGDEVNCKRTVMSIITMNPGYAGRATLPEGLKALFRPMTVMVPDMVLICENMLMAEGFTGEYSKRRERASRNGSTVVKISIPPPSFKPVSLS